MSSDIVSAKRSSPLAGGDGKAGVEVVAQGGGTLEADQLGDAIDGMAAYLQQLLTAPESASHHEQTGIYVIDIIRLVIIWC